MMLQPIAAWVDRGLTALGLVALLAVPAAAQTPPVITSITPPRQVLNAGESLTLSVTATNVTSYQWSRNNQPIPGATNSSYTINNAQRFLNDGWYVVRITNTGGETLISTEPPSIFVRVDPATGSVRPIVWGNGHPAPAGLSGVVAVAAGRSHSLALKQDGMVIQWGAANVAAAPADLADVYSVAAGNEFSLALKKNGEVVAWGANTFGQSTVPAGLPEIVAIAAGRSHSLALKKDGTVAAWGSNEYGQTLVPATLSGVVAVAAGWFHSLALRKDGTVVAWGANSNNQSTVPLGLSEVVAVSGASRGSLALKQDGTTAGWGLNPASDSEAVAVAGGNAFTLVLKSDLTLVARRSPPATNHGQATVPAGLSRVLGIAAGDEYSLAIYDSSADAAPTLTSQPASASHNLNDAASFSVGAAPIFPSVQWQWRKNSVNITGATSSTYSIPAVASSDAGTYDVVVTNYLGSVTSAPAALTVNPAAYAAIATQPSNVTANIGATATLSFTATGNPTPTVQWYKNGTAISGATNATYTIPSVSRADAATYTATVSNVYNGATYTLSTSPAILTVNGLPVFTLQPLSQSVVAGSPLTLSAAVQGLAPTTFQWRRNGIAIAGATGSSYGVATTTVNDSGTYTVVAINAEGATTSEPAELLVNPAPPPAISGAPASVTVPSGERTQLKVSATGTGPLSYQWYQGTSGSTTSLVAGATAALFTTPSLTTTTNYWVRITDANGSVTNSPTATVTVSATSPLNVTQVALGAGYVTGGVVAVTNTITYTGTAPSRIDWATLLPAGWKYLGSGGSEGGARPVYESGDLLEWSWTTVPPSPIKFTYMVSVPAGTTGDQVIASLVTSQAAGTQFQTMAKPDPLVLRSASLHTADTNRDGRIGLLELTRVIELYNYRSGGSRTGQYKPKAGTEDGFDPGP